MNTKIISRKLEMIDTDKETKEHSGFVSFKEMQECFRGSSMLTQKETNLLLREYVMKYGYDKILYTNFENDLIDVRFELLENRTTATNLTKFPVDNLLQQVADMPEMVKPFMSIQELRDCLYCCK